MIVFLACGNMDLLHKKFALMVITILQNHWISEALLFSDPKKCEVNQRLCRTARCVDSQDHPGEPVGFQLASQVLMQHCTGWMHGECSISFSRGWPERLQVFLCTQEFSSFLIVLSIHTRSSNPNLTIYSLCVYNNI